MKRIIRWLNANFTPAFVWLLALLLGLYLVIGLGLAWAWYSFTYMQ